MPSSSSPVLSLTPASGTFPFTTKYIPLPSGSKVTLGSSEASGKVPKVPASSNGWFPPQQTEDSSIPHVLPLTLSSSHALLWSDGSRVYIRDLESAFGTFVNGKRISQDTPLKAGDLISLGNRIPRNEKTPAYITDLHLVPVVARVSL